MIGTILGNRYRILRDIGSGGMARVYLAEDMNEGQLVAVKVLYPHFGEDISYIQRFSREAKLAEALENEHVVRVLDYGSSRDTHYIVMEYVQGRDLRTVLNERGPLKWQEALEMIDQVCEALEEANRHNIVHRDIKPQNIMMADGGLLKVLDFGIARSRMLPSLTQSGFVGSPYYISPEQAMGEEVDIRSDIYSTGIVLFELLSGRVPFDAKSPWSIISQHIASEPPQIEVEDTATPEPVQKLLKRMIAKNAGDRFQSPTTVRQALGAIQAGRDLPADLGTPPPTSTDRIAMADGLYRRALDSLEQEQWQKAVNLLNQVLDLDPDHANALSKRAEAGTQARLKALYQAASRAMENQRWQEAIDELTEILEIEPDYKDSVKLLVQTRNAIEKQNVNLELSELYDKAIAHFEAEEYDQAEQLFGQIRKISPLYRRVDALWAESRRRKSQEGGFARLNENLAHTQSGNRSSRALMKRPQVHWLAATGLVVLGIIVTIWLVSLSTSPGDSDLSADELYTQAQAAFENGDRSQARQLIEQALAADSAYEPAVELESQLTQLDALDGRLAEAESAINTANWTQAIETLKALHDNQPDFQTERVATALCDAYLARGQERMDGISNPRDQATVRAALTDFRAGELTCSSRSDLEQALAFATDYLEAIAGGGTADAVIEALSTIIDVEPDYAGEQAVQNLYLAYLNRGDAAREQGNRADAATDYEAAAALNVADVSEAQARLSQLPATDEPEVVATETPSAEVEATATTDASTASDEVFTYRAPSLVSPDPYVEYAGQFTEIILVWQPLDLEPNTYYDVTIRYFVGNEPRYWGGPVTTNSWRVPVEAGYGQAGQDLFAWWVTVRESGTDKQLSPPSEERYFYWRPG